MNRRKHTKTVSLFDVSHVANEPSDLTSHSTNETMNDVSNMPIDGQPETIRMIEFYHTDNRDNRPFVIVKVRNKEIRALMDTGANICVLGQNLVKSVSDWGDEMMHSTLTITTADQTPHKVKGVINVDYHFLGRNKVVQTVVVPTDTHYPILGMDFIRAFDIDLVAKNQENSVHTLEADEGHQTMKVETVDLLSNVDEMYSNSFAQLPKLDEGRIELTRITNEQLAVMRYPHMANEMKTAFDHTDAYDDVRPAKIPCVTEPHELTELQREQLDSVLAKFQNTPTAGLLNATSKMEHVIDTGEHMPFRARQYTFSPYVIDSARKEVETLLERGIIREIEESPWRSPILIVKKKDGTGRVCLDARMLNKITTPNAYPITDTNQILARLKTSKYMTSIDLSQAFFQIPLETESQLKTTFAFGNQLFCYQRMPMGLRNSPATLAILIDKIFRDLYPRAFSYVDDFIVCTDTFGEHLELLSIIAERLSKVNLTISPTKSHFCCKQLEFLGYILSENGLAVNPDKVKAIMEYKRPETVKEVRRLIGAAGWYRRFIPKFSQITAPLTELIKTNCTTIDWNEQAEESFIELKKRLISTPILAMCDYTKTFTIYCDASDVAGASVLTQQQDGESRVIYYHSFKFTVQQRKYCATERECLALINAVEHFRPYIQGTQFNVITDHQALKWLMTLKDPTGRLARWALRLQVYLADMNIEHRKGTEMELPDALSRAVEMITPITETKDPWYNEMVRRAQNDWCQFYKVENGMLYRQGNMQKITGDRVWVVCIPSEQVEEVLRTEHDELSHHGIWKVLSRLRLYYYWPNQRKSVQEYINRCIICRKVKSSNENTRVPMGEYRDPKSVGRCLSVDMTGNLPMSRQRNRCVCVIIDCFSRYVFTKPMRSATALKIVMFLEEEVFMQNGIPETIISDNGPQFISTEFKDMCTEFGIRHHKTPNYHPQANQVEATNKTIKTSLQVQLEGLKSHTEWEQYLTQIVRDMNITPHTSTNVSPYFLQYGREYVRHGNEHSLLLDANPDRELTKERRFVIHDDAGKTQREKYDLRKRKHDVGIVNRTFDIGQVVYIDNNKLSNAGQRYSAKLATKKIRVRIRNKVGNNTYEIETEKGKVLGNYHAQDIYTR